MQRHDQRAKRIAEQALDPFGDVTREFAVPAPDDQRGDLWFQRTRFPTDVPSYLQLFDTLFPMDTMIEGTCLPCPPEAKLDRPVKAAKLEGCWTGSLEIGDNGRNWPS